MKRAKIILLIAVAAATLFFLLERNLLPGLTTNSSQAADFKLLEKVISLIKNHYFEVPDPIETMEGAFRGLVNSLDPVSSYLDKENALKYQQQKEAPLKETGLILYKEQYGYYPQVISIIENSPAQKEGIELGELIVSIDRKPTRSMSMLEANLSLKGQDETSLYLEIIRGRETQELRIRRELLFSEPASYFAQRGTSGILKIHHLYPSCVSRIKEGLLLRLKIHKDPLILDLRDCYEGELEEGVKLSNLFLKAKEIGTIEKKGGAKDTLSLLEEPELEELPIIIWVNQATIGSAEAVAAILREFREAKILGFPTSGLVAKQSFFALEDGSALVLNSGLFSLKSGKKIWKKGIKPDVAIKSKDLSDDSYLKETMKLISAK